MISPVLFSFASLLPDKLFLFFLFGIIIDSFEEIFENILWNFISSSFSSFEIERSFVFKKMDGSSVLSFCVWINLLDSKAIPSSWSSISSLIRIISSAWFSSLMTLHSWAFLIIFLTNSGWRVEKTPQKKSLWGTYLSS